MKLAKPTHALHLAAVDGAGQVIWMDGELVTQQWWGMWTNQPIQKDCLIVNTEGCHTYVQLGHSCVHFTIAPIAVTV